MHVSDLVGRKMVMNHVVHSLDIQASCCQVGADEHIATSACKAMNGSLTQLLIQATMKEHGRYAMSTKILTHSFYTLSVTQKDKTLAGTKHT